jgi:hypothetical protein
MRKIYILIVLLGIFGYGISNDSLSITYPTKRIVFQRNNNNTAIILVKGDCPASATSVEARLVARVKGQGSTTKWIKIDNAPAGGSYKGIITGTGGWYNLEVCAKTKRKQIAAAMLERVGIGEVFLIAGHSVAQGGDINMEGSSDDRVSTVQLNEKSDTFEIYLKTGDPQYLPAPVFVQAASGVAHAPFGHHSYFWSNFGQKLAEKENVPVLIYNAGFGGTSLEHWAKSAHNIQFEHGFVRSGIRMPYINVYNTLTKYIPLTGIRAILADQGQNDAGQKDPDTILNNYRIFIAKAREDLHYPELALVVNRQMPSSAPQVKVAQEKMTKEPYCFPGPDYDTGLLKEDKVDGIHLSAQGLPKAATLWVNALTPDFFEKSKPWLPSFK